MTAVIEEFLEVYGIKGARRRRELLGAGILQYGELGVSGSSQNRQHGSP